MLTLGWLAIESDFTRLQSFCADGWRQLFGLVGVLIALPVAAVIVVALKQVLSASSEFEFGEFVEAPSDQTDSPLVTETQSR